MASAKWKTKLVELFVRHGAPVRFAVGQILPVLLPGSPAVVKLVEDLLGCVHEGARDRHSFIVKEEQLPSASGADLERVEGILTILGGDLSQLVQQVGYLEGIPAAVEQVVNRAMLQNAPYRQAATQLVELAQGLEGLAVQNRKILAGQGILADSQEEMLRLMKLSVLQQAALYRELAGRPEAEAVLPRFREASRALGEGRFFEATAPLQVLAKEHPELAAPAVAEAVAQAGSQDWSGAEVSLTRAERLRPDDTGLAEVRRQVTRYTRAHKRSATVTQANPATPGLGDEVAGWRLDALLGRGGFGQVYRATKGRKRAAIKLLHPDLGVDPAAEACFRKEILTLCQLPRHPNLVEILDFDKVGNTWCLIMALVEGETLETHLSRTGPLSEQVARTVFTQVAEGLALVHEQGRVHRASSLTTFY